MSAPQLHTAARVLYQSPLAKYLEATAKRQEAAGAADAPQAVQKSPYPSSCARCSEIWVPAVTCKVRVSATKVVPDAGRRGSSKHCGQNKNKRARQRALKRRDHKQSRMVEKLKKIKGPKFREVDVHYLHFDCLACQGHSTLPVFSSAKQTKVPLGAVEPKGKQIKGGNSDPSSRLSTPALSNRGLSLADFML